MSFLSLPSNPFKSQNFALPRCLRGSGDFGRFASQFRLRSEGSSVSYRVTLQREAWSELGGYFNHVLVSIWVGCAKWQLRNRPVILA